jgi:hypothetical protein
MAVELPTPGSDDGVWGPILNDALVALDAAVSDVVTALAGLAEADHNHSIGDVSGLSVALDGKAAATHAHAMTDVTGLSGALSGKASASHTHAISAIVGLQAELDAAARLLVDPVSTVGVPDGTLIARTS